MIISLVLLGIVLATFAPVVPVTMYYRIGNGNGLLYNMNARGSLTYLMFHCGEISYQVMGSTCGTEALRPEQVQQMKKGE